MAGYETDEHEKPAVQEFLTTVRWYRGRICGERVKWTTNEVMEKTNLHVKMGSIKEIHYEAWGVDPEDRAMHIEMTDK